MGCVSSKSDDHCRPNVFHVWNVDDMGNRVNPGEIVITETDLILYQRGKLPIRWPMRSLRRYGFDSELFSFESGRRCPTGPGVYAFRCRRAEALFTLLQEHIQSVGNIATTSNEEQASVPNAASASLVNVDDLQRPLEETVVNVTNNQEPRYCGCPCPTLASVSAADLESLQNPVVLPESAVSVEGNQYVNGDIIQSECSNVVKEHEYVNTVVCPKRPTAASPPAAAAAVVGSEHEYMNTGILAAEGATASLEPVSSRVGDVNANTTTKTKNDKVESNSNPPAYCNIQSTAPRPAKVRLTSQGSFSSTVATQAETLPHSNSISHKSKPVSTKSKNIHINGIKLKRDPFYSNVSPMGPSASSSTTPKITSKKTVHYAVLDLNGIETSLPGDATDNDMEDAERDLAGASDGSDDGNNGKGYVTIDFDKTAALLNSTTNRQKQTVEILKKSQSDSMSK